MCKGIIFNIQKFSIHDGPGIRTTVFFKGCPLQCTWCANPESQLEEIQILHDQTKCILCKKCITICPKKAISLQDNHIVINFNTCNGCLQCVQHCPSIALQPEGSKKTIEEVVSICLQDKEFYEESNGGITISGGEGMSQPHFLKELVKTLKKHSLHVAIETTGYIQPQTFQEVAPMFDLLLFDIKHYNTTAHLQGTGVKNEVIINNLIWAIHHNIEVLPRIPIIPTFNDTIEDAKGFTDFLLSIGINKVQLLPFHQFGEKKYTLLNKEYQFKNKKALHPEDLKEYQQLFLDKGIDCFF